MKVCLNTNAASGPYPDALRSIISREAHRAAHSTIRGWPGYEPTPLHDAAPFARELDLAALWVKDESRRFGLGSFKALGGAYGVLRVMDEATAPDELTVTCASDGNHGRAVAWGASLFGCQALVFLPSHVTEARAEAIRELGAKVERVDGEYDDAVARADDVARREGYVVVSDTAYPGYEDIPRTVMQGYTVMVGEVMSQLHDITPTHVFVQGGVGGLAAAVLGHLWEEMGADLPRFVIVEPESADCLYQSSRSGTPTPASGDLHTVMAGLSCRHVSTLAWAILRPGASAFATVSDEGVFPLMRRLARGEAGAPIEGGESGVAGLLGLVEASSDQELRDVLGLNTASRVLAFNTEGATDPALYRRILTGDDGTS